MKKFIKENINIIFWTTYIILNIWSIIIYYQKDNISAMVEALIQIPLVIAIMFLLKLWDKWIVLIKKYEKLNNDLMKDNIDSLKKLSKIKK
jgi:amino acid permease